MSLLVASIAVAGRRYDRSLWRTLGDERGAVTAAIAVFRLSQANSALSRYGAWIMVDMAMATILYEAVFDTISGKHGDDVRRGVTPGGSSRRKPIDRGGNWLSGFGAGNPSTTASTRVYAPCLGRALEQGAFGISHATVCIRQFPHRRPQAPP